MNNEELMDLLLSIKEMNQDEFVSTIQKLQDITYEEDFDE